MSGFLSHWSKHMNLKCTDKKTYNYRIQIHVRGDDPKVHRKMSLFLYFSHVSAENVIGKQLK